MPYNYTSNLKHPLRLKVPLEFIFHSLWKHALDLALHVHHDVSQNPLLLENLTHGFLLLCSQWVHLSEQITNSIVAKCAKEERRLNISTWVGWAGSAAAFKRRGCRQQMSNGHVSGGNQRILGRVIYIWLCWLHSRRHHQWSTCQLQWWRVAAAQGTVIVYCVGGAGGSVISCAAFHLHFGHQSLLKWRKIILTSSV